MEIVYTIIVQLGDHWYIMSIKTETKAPTRSTKPSKFGIEVIITLVGSRDNGYDKLGPPKMHMCVLLYLKVCISLDQYPFGILQYLAWGKGNTAVYYALGWL